MKPGNSVDVTVSSYDPSMVLLTLQHGPVAVTVALDEQDVRDVIAQLHLARRTALFPPLANGGRAAPT